MHPFTPEDLQLILQLTNAVEVKGLQSMQAMLQLATKCQTELNNIQAQQAPAPTETVANATAPAE